MGRSASGRACRAIAVFGLAMAALTTVTSAASSGRSGNPATGTSAYMVVLDCDGVRQRTVPDAEGRFVFSDVPQGACTVSAVATVPSEAAAPEASSAARAGAVMAPRDAASGMATGKRQHKPMSVHVMLDGEPSVARVATADHSSRASVSVMVKERRKELTGHVTLIK